MHTLYTLSKYLSQLLHLLNLWIISTGNLSPPEAQVEGGPLRPALFSGWPTGPAFFPSYFRLQKLFPDNTILAFGPHFINVILSWIWLLQPLHKFGSIRLSALDSQKHFEFFLLELFLKILDIMLKFLVVCEWSAPSLGFISPALRKLVGFEALALWVRWRAAHQGERIFAEKKNSFTSLFQQICKSVFAYFLWYFFVFCIFAEKENSFHLSCQQVC